MPTLISADELAEALRSARPPVVLDVRWALGGPPGHGEYLLGHIPGAVFADLEAELARHGDARDGRHPLPDPAQLQEAARRWGINAGDRVVAYDASGNLAAARAWWLLRWAGVEYVRLLDGALAAWIRSGGPMESGDVVPHRGAVELTVGALPTLAVDDVAAFAREGVLLDARAVERFRGDTEPIDPKAGHIPGARNAPTSANLDDDGHFLPAAQLRRRFEELGVGKSSAIAAYCGSGVTACHEIAALAIAGYDASLYAGSWSQWSNLDLPVATGD